MADPGPFKIDQKSLISASLNLDNLKMKKKAPMRRNGRLPELSPRSDRGKQIFLNSCIIEKISDKSSDSESNVSRPMSGNKKL